MFSAHSPATGGGAVILRSLVKNLPELDIQWKYLAAKPSKDYEDGYMGHGIMGSSLLNDIRSTWCMLAGLNLKRIDEIVKQLLAIECDAYWVISHNEGVRIALELSKRQSARPVHMTVHDDWAGALAARSMRYKFMEGLAKKMTIKALKAVTGIDLISKGMQDYYLQICNRSGEICHRYLPPETVIMREFESNPSIVNVGHIGSVYDKSDFIQFLDLLKDYGQQNKRKVLVNMWGYHPQPDDIPQQYNKILNIQQDLPEEKAILELAKCDFVYSMYPNAEALRIFSKTSLPTKLSSYVQACRPIFGHGTIDSSLAEFLSRSSTGVLWSDNNKKNGMAIIDGILSDSINTEKWQEARAHYFGEKNLDVIRRAFIPVKMNL